MEFATLERATGRTVAFVGEGTEVEVNRLVDDGLLPAKFVHHAQPKREYKLWETALALRFNRRCKGLLTKEARKSTIRILADRYVGEISTIFIEIMSEPYIQAAAINRAIERNNWRVSLGEVSVDLTDDLKSTAERIKLLSTVEQSITIDPETMDGAPVFKGTRLPIETALASLDSGVTMAEMVEDYPMLSAEKIEQARIYVALHPRPGRPKKLRASSPHITKRRINAPASRG